MKFKINNKYFRLGLTAFLVIAASICFYYLIFHGSNIKAGVESVTSILMPVLFGFITAYLLTPALNYIECQILFPLCDKCKIKETKRRNSVVRAISIFLTAVLFFALIYILISMMLSQIVPSIMNIVSNFGAYINNFTEWINQLLENNKELSDYIIKIIDRYSAELEQWLNDTLFSKSSMLIKTVSLSVISTLGVLWDFIVGFVIAIYVLASKERFAGQAKKMIYAIFERSTANIVIRNFRFTHRTFIGFIGGKIIDSIIIGILCFIGTTLLNTPYAALISVIIGVTNVIPFFGPYLGAIPCTILIFVIDPVNFLNCVYFALFILALQQFDGNVLGPKILGDSTGLTGFWVIFSITVFGGLFGVIGMIIGVPFFAVIYAAIKSLVNTSLKKKNMPQETKCYIHVGFVEEDGFHEYIPEYRKTKKRGNIKEQFGKYLHKNKADTQVEKTEEKQTEEKQSEENTEDFVNPFELLERPGFSAEEDSDDLQNKEEKDK